MGTHKLRLRWESPHSKSSAKPTPLIRTKAILARLVKTELLISLLEKPFRLFCVYSIEPFFSLPHISRQTASGLRKDRPGFSQGATSLAGRPS